MRLNAAQRWVRCQRDRIISPLMRADQWIRTNDAVEATDRWEPGFALPGLPSLLLLGSLLVDIAWLGACFLIATRSHISIALVLASLPILKWLLLLGCRYSGQRGRAEQPLPESAPAQSGAFGPSSSAGERLALPSPRSRYQDLGDSMMVGNRVGGQIREWLSGNGWKYRVVGGWLPPRRTVSPFGTVPDWWKVYQIAVEDSQGLVEHGWVRLGNGKVDFQLETDRPRRALVVAQAQAGPAEQDFPAEAMRVLASPNPLVQPIA